MGSVVTGACRKSGSSRANQKYQRGRWRSVGPVGTESPLAAAKRLAPVIRSSADRSEADRELPRPLFEALADAGMFRLALPRAIGGTEIDVPAYVEILEEIGKADASAAWIVNQCAIFATYAARMPRDVARLIWIDTPRSVVANTPLPTAQAVVVPGGYRVSGRQGFSSGCRHAAWLAARARVLENGQLRLQDGQPEQRYLFVPAGEAELLDTWKVRGMRGTGTHDFVVKGVFVPEERTVLQSGAPLVESGPLYQIPRTLLFASGDAAIALGVARSCLEAFFELAATKTPRAMEATLRDQPLVQATVGHAEANLRSGRAFLTEAVQDLWAEVTATGATTQERRALLRLATTHAIRLAVRVVDAIYNAAGMTAIYEGNLIQRHFQDIHVISQHMQGRLSYYELIGRHLLGITIDLTRP
ncbi:MAG TPA: acyl-CoA dehydrogenase family protein [Candidatus Acidoferrales bacterium]|nr:acyl-CoA dehydrogenase family protein [Candidatus Acidoferrales bacterium]